MSSPAPVAHPARPALADRDCSNVKMAPNRSATFTAVSRPRHPQATAGKDSYAAVTSNTGDSSHSGHKGGNNNGHGGHGHGHGHGHGNGHAHMTRRRSFQSNRSSAQAAQEGYYMRKAAKAIAEKRKAAAAAAAAASAGGNTAAASDGASASTAPPTTTEASSSASTSATPTTAVDPAHTSDPASSADGLPSRASVPVINVTIDSAGVRIRDGPSPSPGPRRRGSHARLSRSVSRGRSEDKENCASAGNNDPPSGSASFSHRRGSKRDLSRRGSSKDFNNNKNTNSNNSNTNNNNNAGASNGSAAGAANAAGTTPQGATEQTKDGENSWDGSMPRRQSSRGLIERNARVENRAHRTPVEQDSSERVLHRSLSRSSSIARDDNEASSSRMPRLRGGAESGGEEGHNSSGRIEFRRAQSQIAVSNDFLSLDVAPRPAPATPAPALAPAASVDMLKVDIPPRPAPAPAKEAEGVEKTTDESQISESSETSEARSSSTADSKMPTNGKWCDECAGLGMTIAAMLAELETSHPAPEGAKRLSSGKKSWRTVVSQTMLGSGGESKTASERARLLQENTVLRTTVEFLYNKVAQLEQGASAAAAAAATAAGPPQ